MNGEMVDRYVLVVAVLSSFAVAFVSNALSVALPVIAGQFHISNIVQNWLVTVYLLVITVACVPFGKVCSKYGLKRTLKIGLVIFIAGGVLSVLSFDITLLFMSRIVQAVGSAILFVNVMSIITAQIPVERRGRSIGLTITGVYLGLATGPSVSGILSQIISWRSIFLVTIPLAVISYCLLYRIPLEWSFDEDCGIDIKGSVLYVTGIVFLISGFSTLNRSSGFIIMMAGLMVLLLFVWYELRIENPVYDMRLFRNRTYTASNVASLISYFATFVVTYILNYHFQYIRGFDTRLSGMVLIITPVVMAVVAPVAGRISDRSTPQIIAAAGMGCVSVAMFILVFLDRTTPFAYILIAMVLQGMGYGLFSSPNSNIIMSSVDKKDIGTASASLSTVRTIGQTFSLGLLTLVFAVIMGNVEITPANYPLLITSSQITMIISTILCVTAVILSLTGLEKSEK